MLLAAPAVSACGGSATTTSTTASRSPGAHARTSLSAVAHAPPARPATLVYRPWYQLPAPLKDPAFAVLGGGRFALLGGLDSSEVSSAGIEIADGRACCTPQACRWPSTTRRPQSSAARCTCSAALIDRARPHRQLRPHSRRRRTVGTLPRAQSDVAVTAAGGTAYVVGGYDGTNWLNTILAWRPGSPVRVAGHLPVGLPTPRQCGRRPDPGDRRVGARGASDAIYRFDPGAARSARSAGWPQPITHASAAALGGFV